MMEKIDIQEQLQNLKHDSIVSKNGIIAQPPERPLSPGQCYQDGPVERPSIILTRLIRRITKERTVLAVVRTALVALIAFMPTDPGGALGSLDYKKEERRALAVKSREAAPRYGNPERQKLMDEIHEYMVSKAPPIPLLPTAPTTEEQVEQIDAPNTNIIALAEDLPNQADENGMVEDVREVRVNAAAGRLRVSFSAGVRLSRRVPEAEEQQPQMRNARKSMDDRVFTWAAVGLTIAILVLVMKKFLKSNGITGYMDA